ncbi:MAG: DEAD/DEAH box helicase [Bacteroidota bacterium]
MLTLIRTTLQNLESSDEFPARSYRQGRSLYIEGQCQVLSQSTSTVEVLVEEEEQERVLTLTEGTDHIGCFEKSKPLAWNYAGVAALYQALEELEAAEPHSIREGKAYTREGMMKRVLAERRAKAAKADYRIQWAESVHGEHVLTNEKGKTYRITLRDLEKETGYIDNPDLKTNKLGTTKHLMWAYAQLREQPELRAQMTEEYPFVEVYLDPLNDYRITWHYPHALPESVAELLGEYFTEGPVLPEVDTPYFLSLIQKSHEHPKLKIRPEVVEKVRQAWDRKTLEKVQAEKVLDLSALKVSLFPYQETGVRFATYREGAIIADEMGLGKTIQAIATAVSKKNLFGFRRTLVVCPASLKEQWKQEIEKFCREKAVIAEGMPQQRAAIYRETEAYFVIVNYETVLRDLVEINRMAPDFVVLDEAQRIKNFNTVTAQTIKRIRRKHALVITGTPIENRLIDLYSIMGFVDPEYLAPLWEFSYQHCYFDQQAEQKITGYYNLQQLNERLKQVLLRREKRKVLQELPNVTEMQVPVELSVEQQAYHADFAAGVSAILGKKYVTPFDQQRLMLLLNQMRMVCDSTFLIDKETYVSPKLKELRHILLEKLDLPNNERKVIIFSEWTTMLNLIGKELKEMGITYVMLSGKVAVKNRDKLVKKFANDPKCQVFLSTEAGGAGLNLQMADTVINFELPWNPAKKNQRIGRIDRLGQRHEHLTVINFITKQSIEMKIASGLSLKTNLFEGVLNADSELDIVDFSAAGRSQFLQELEAALGELQTEQEEEAPEAEALAATEAAQAMATTAEDLVAEEETPPLPTTAEAPNGQTAAPNTPKPEQLQQAMTQGMQFLSTLMQMTTGQAVGLEGQQVTVDPKTGEVTMKFKLPGMKPTP